MFKVIVSGNLGADPELRYSATGTPIVQFRMAVNSRRKSGEEWEDHTDWIRVSMGGPRAQYLSEHLAKGLRVTVVGNLKIDEYTSRDGDKRTSLDVWADEVEFSAPRQENDEDREPSAAAAPARSAPASRPSAAAPADDDNDLPF